MRRSQSIGGPSLWEQALYVAISKPGPSLSANAAVPFTPPPPSLGETGTPTSISLSPPTLAAELPLNQHQAVENAAIAVAKAEAALWRLEQVY
jgi:hypothetical protein